MNYKSPELYPEQVILKETEHWYITLSANQYYLGRAIIGMKTKEVRHLSDLSPEELNELWPLVASYEIALKKTFDTTHFNWTCLMNNSYKEKNLNSPDELHLHVWPRYKQVREFEGEIFNDEVFGHHYDKHKEKTVNRELLIKMADRILGNWKE